MVSNATDMKTLVYGTKLSSVAPGTVTGEGRAQELTGQDLAMKLHYLRGVYFFDKEVVAGSTIYDLKKPMFGWLIHFFTACGRIRISEDGDEGEPGRPFIKLNDGGIRIVEAQCSKSLKEWLAMEECCSFSDEFLVYGHALGPDLFFTPLVFLQFTWFQCGGVSVGLSWAHVLGDPFSATSFMTLLGHFMRPNTPSKPLPLPGLKKPEYPVPSPAQQPSSIKRVNPVGSLWVAPPTATRMLSHTLHFSQKDLDRLRSSIQEDPTKYGRIRTFDLISAAIWKSLARIRGESQPKTVTVCRFRSKDRASQIPRNEAEICAVEADSMAPSEADLSDLAALLAEKAVDESAAIGETVDREIGESDFVVYGARLTFVDLEGADLYGLEMNGKKPVFVNYTIGGVGEDGVVMVLPAPEESGGRVVTVILPESEMEAVRRELMVY